VVRRVPRRDSRRKQVMRDGTDVFAF
jgi:hypothetical protein